MWKLRLPPLDLIARENFDRFPEPPKKNLELLRHWMMETKATETQDSVMCSPSLQRESFVSIIKLKNDK